MKFYNDFLSFLFPESCMGCSQAGIPLCTGCIAKIPPPREFNSKILSLFDFQNPIIRQAIHEFKYKNRRTVGKILGNELYKVYSFESKGGGSFFNLKHELLIPIPLSKERRKIRGFNQTEFLIREMLTHDTLGLLRTDNSILCRTVNTEPQVLIKDRDLRLENIKGCFTLKNSEKIIGKNIIILDDVTTTGATIEEARRVLLKAGAQRVDGLTIAH